MKGLALVLSFALVFVFATVVSACPVAVGGSASAFSSSAIVSQAVVSQAVVSQAVVVPTIVQVEAFVPVVQASAFVQGATVIAAPVVRGACAPRARVFGRRTVSRSRAVVRSFGF